MHTRAKLRSVGPETTALSTQVQRICRQAASLWWRDNHEGWMIFAIDGRQFETLDQIVAFSQVPARPGLGACRAQHHPLHPRGPPSCLQLSRADAP